MLSLALVLGLGLSLRTKSQSLVLSLALKLQYTADRISPAHQLLYLQSNEDSTINTMSTVTLCQTTARQCSVFGGDVRTCEKCVFAERPSDASKQSKNVKCYFRNACLSEVQHLTSLNLWLLAMCCCS